MNIRNSITTKDISFEHTLTELFSWTLARQQSKRALSGKFILHYIYFFNNKNDIQCYIDTKERFSHSIFSDAYIEELLSKPLTDTELLYYILHLDNKVPTTLGPKLSNWVCKNEDSTTGQPPEIRDMIFNIDLRKLARHFELYTTISEQSNEQLREQLQQYIQTVFVFEPRIAGVCNEYCTTLFEQLAWITVYALADKDCFNQFENEYRIVLQEQKVQGEFANSVTHATRQMHQDSPQLTEKQLNLKRNIANAYKKYSFYNQIATCILIILTILQIICITAPISTITKQSIILTNNTLFYIVMLSFSVLLLSLRFIPIYLSSKANQLHTILNHYDIDPNLHEFAKIKNVKTQGITYKIFKDTTTEHTTREKTRVILNICTTLSIIILFILSVVMQSFPIVVAGISLIMVFYIYIDLIYIDWKFTNHYNELDKRGSSDTKHPISLGFAKIFAWEYNKHHHHFMHTNIQQTEHSPQCTRYIFISVADRIKNNLIVSTCIILVCNITALIAGIVEYMLPYNTYFKFNEPRYYSVFAFSLVLIIGIANIILLIRTNDAFKQMYNFQYLAGADYMNDDVLVHKYCNYYDKRMISELDIARGIYKYNCKEFEKGHLITDITPESDRMILLHQHLGSAVRTTISVWLLCLAFLSIVVWHCQITAGLWAIPIFAILNVLLVLLILPRCKEKQLGTVIKHKKL